MDPESNLFKLTRCSLNRLAFTFTRLIIIEPIHYKRGNTHYVSKVLSAPLAPRISFHKHLGPKRFQLPETEKGRTGRQLSRHAGQRPVPLDGRHKKRGRAVVDRGGEQAHRLVSRVDPRTRQDQGSPDRALELRALLSSVEGR